MTVGIHGNAFAYHRQRTVERVVRAMNGCIGQDMSNEDMARLACLSPFHFSRKFRRITGVPPIQFFQALRLQHAKNLLLNTDRRVTDICFEVGYSSFGTFVTRFNYLVGACPTSFRRLAHRFRHMRLEDVRPIIAHLGEPTSGANVITGDLVLPDSFEGIVFTGLFRRAIPMGAPVACSVTIGSGQYSLPAPEDGKWHVMSLAVPWTTDFAGLLNPTSLLRGHVRGTVRKGCWSGQSRMVLGLPELWYPPILTALPALLDQDLEGLLLDSAEGASATDLRSSHVWPEAMVRRNSLRPTV